MTLQSIWNAQTNMSQIFHKWPAISLVCPKWTASEPMKIKMRSFQDHPDGWCCGEGVGLKEDVARFTEELYTSLGFVSFSSMDVFPRSNGGIELHVYWARGHIELFINPAGTFDYLEFDDRDEITDEGEDLLWCDAKSVIKSSLRKMTVLSERFLASRNSYQKRTDSHQMCLPIPATVQAYLFSTSLAPKTPAAPFVNIFNNTTHVCLGNLLPS